MSDPTGLGLLLLRVVVGIVMLAHGIKHARGREKTSGWFEVMACAMCCISTVLPVRGCATISARWPLPSGATISMTRVE